VHTSLTDDTLQTVTADSTPTGGRLLDVAPTADGGCVTGDAIEGSTPDGACGPRASDETETVSYQWQRDGVDISNASGSTYQLVEGDENHKITVHTSLTDDTLQTVTADSTPTADGC